MKKITIPEKHYVGMQVRSQNKIPLGFITPWGEDASAKKRMDTVDSWANSRRGNSLPTAIIDNIPMMGFRLTSDLRTGSYGAADKWRIEDPRGFELEINSSNLAMLLADSTVEKGEILDQCIWARDGGQNLLLSVESEEYKSALEMTKIVRTSASWKDARLGDTVILQNGIKGTYFGKMHVLKKVYDQDLEISNLIQPSDKSFFVVMQHSSERTYPEGLTRELHFLSTPKLSGIISETEIDVKQAEVIVNEALTNPDCYVSQGASPVLASASPIKIEHYTLSLEETQIRNDLWKHRYQDPDRFVQVGNVIGWPSERYAGSVTQQQIISPLRIDLLPKGIVARTRKSSSGLRGYNNRKFDSVCHDVDPNDVTNVYLLKIRLQTKAGNTFEGTF